MVNFKLVIGAKKGKTVQKEVQEAEAKTLLGRKIGDKVDGGKLGFPGYEFQITGGSDYCGFPMRKDVDGFARRRILAVEGIGLKKKAKGIRVRKTVCGNTIHPKISQVNVKIIKEGKDSLFETEGGKVEEDKTSAPEEEKKEQAPAPVEEKKEEAPAPEEKKEEPAEEKKEEPAEEGAEKKTE